MNEYMNECIFVTYFIVAHSFGVVIWLCAEVAVPGTILRVTLGSGSC